MLRVVVGGEESTRWLVPPGLGGGDGEEEGGGLETFSSIFCPRDTASEKAQAEIEPN